jgi:6-methylsalicylate decarboxylase
MMEGDKPSASDSWIDVHAHYLPTVYYDALRDAGVTKLDGGIPIPRWTIEESLGMMDRCHTATQILSLSSPSVQFVRGPAVARLARAVNEAGAAYVKAHPGRFGLFATLPLEDVAASLAEIAVAFDNLGADGIVLMTNAHGIYLGSEALEPVFDELNRRRAVVFLHPTSPACFEALSLGRPAPMIEFPFDTTRAAVNLVFSGTTRRCPEIKFILPHAGGTLPFLVQRIIRASSTVSAGMNPTEALAEMQRFYCDTAGAANGHAIPALRRLIPVTQILFGGDFPFTPEPTVGDYVAFLRSTDLFTDGERVAVARGNALKLFPRLARDRELRR